AAAWVEGHGIHLAANAIGHLLKDQPGPAQDLTEFWDERFGHYLWHSAALGLTALVLVRAARSDPADLPDATTRGRAWMAIAGAEDGGGGRGGSAAALGGLVRLLGGAPAPVQRARLDQVANPCRATELRAAGRASGPPAAG